MPYQLAPIPWCLATGDGLPAKTDKAKMLHTLETDQAAIVNPGNDKISAYIIDGNALLHSLTSIPDNFGQLAGKVFNCLSKVNRIDFVTDTYCNNQ